MCVHHILEWRRMGSNSWVNRRTPSNDPSNAETTSGPAFHQPGEADLSARGSPGSGDDTRNARSFKVQPQTTRPSIKSVGMRVAPNGYRKVSTLWPARNAHTAKQRDRTNRHSVGDVSGLIEPVSHPSDVANKKVLLAHVWPEVTVKEVSLRLHIVSLRNALCGGKHGLSRPGRGEAVVS